MRKKYFSLLFALTFVFSSCGGQPQTALINVVNGTGGGTYNIGSNATITATIPEYKTFKEWQVDNQAVSTSNPYTFEVKENKTFTAMFETVRYTLTVINGTGGGTYDGGSTVRVSPTLEEGERFVSWNVNGEVVSTNQNYTFTLTKNLTIEAITSTDPIPEKVTVTVVNGEGSGIYDKGRNVTITPTLEEGDTFVSWNVGGEPVSYEERYTFVATEDVVITAVIEHAPDPEKVSVTVINGTGSGRYTIGELVIVTPILKPSQEFISWNVEGVPVSTESTYSFIASEDITLTAVIRDIDPMEAYTTSVYMTGDSFKVLNLTDIQMHDGNDLTLFKHIVNTLVDETDPDMIVVLGDTINDDTTYDAKEAAKNIVEFIDSFDIPWAPVFGNHDYVEYHPEGTKKTVGVEYLMQLFDDSDNCLFIKGPDDVLANSNYLVNVLDSNEDIVESFVFLDSRVDGVDETSAAFYKKAINFATKLNDNVAPKSIVFQHIPTHQYSIAYQNSVDNEFHDIIGGPGSRVLSQGTDDLFEAIKELGSTSTIICGHDHEDSFILEYEGIRLVYCMKSSDGDDADGIAFRHPMGGLLLTVDGEEENLEYKRVEDISYTFTKDFDYHPFSLSYWRHSGATLCFDITLPDSGTVQFNIQGTNFMRSSVDENIRKGQWNRLTNHITINASSKTATKGTLTQIEGNTYRYEVDVATLDLNNGGGEISYGDETARLVYFHDANGAFTVTNLHYEFEEIIETDQLDLADASIEVIEDQFYNGLPIRPKPGVTLSGKTLKETSDLIYTFENNVEIGEATLTIVPSGKGAHKYKGEKSIKFNIVKNPDDDTEPGHEDARYIQESQSLVTNDKVDEWVSVKDWYNCGKLLHFEVKRLEYGTTKTGETVRFSLMGLNTNPDAKEPNDWCRLTDYYTIDFSNSQVVVYQTSTPSNIIAEGISMGDNWFSIDIDFKDLALNSTEGAHGNENETMRRVYFDNFKRSFKLDNPCLIEEE